MSQPSSIKRLTCNKSECRYLLAPTSSDVVVMRVFNFCFDDLLCNIPLPIYIVPPVYPPIFLWTACDAFLHTCRSRKLSTSMTLWSLIDPFIKPRKRFNFYQSFSCFLETLVMRYDTAVSTSSLARFIINNNLTVIEWKILPLASYNSLLIISNVVKNSYLQVK